MNVKFEAMEKPNLSGMLNEEGKSARMVGKYKGSKVFTFTFNGSKVFTFTFKGSKVFTFTFKGLKVSTFTFKGSKVFTFTFISTFTFKGSKVKTVVDVLCLPLFTLLAALDFPTVDFFSLDVEGAELGILRTIPWDRVGFTTLDGPS